MTLARILAATMRSAVAIDSHEQRLPIDAPSLTEGRMLRCPNCLILRDPADHRQFKRLGRVEKYAMELNVVYQCVKSTGGCGHIFSPGDQRILIAFLQGDLVPANRQNGSNPDNKEVKH